MHQLISEKLIFATALICGLLAITVSPTSQLEVTSEAKELAAIKECGTVDDLAHRIEVCAKPLLDLIQGTAQFWPKSVPDVKNLCERFQGSERCIRANARKCTKGLHKTIISAVAGSIQRCRKRECQDSRYPQLLKASQCFEKNQRSVQKFVSNLTSHLNVVDEKFIDTDKKVNAVCCMSLDLERGLTNTMNQYCPNDTATICRIIRTVLEDALDIVCRNPKCNNLFKDHRVIVKDTNQFGGMIETMLKILLSLAV